MNTIIEKPKYQKRGDKKNFKIKYWINLKKLGRIIDETYISGFCTGKDNSFR